MAQLSQEERDFVLEKYFEGKATQQFKQHFGKDLIMRHLTKRQLHKTLKNTVHTEPT